MSAETATSAEQFPANDGTPETPKKTKSETTKKTGGFRKRLRRTKGEEAGMTPVIPINAEVATMLQEDQERQQQINALLSSLQEPLPTMLPAPQVVTAPKTSAPKKAIEQTAPQNYNSNDMLYLLSRVVVGPMQIQDISKEPPKKINSIGGFVQAYVFRFNTPAKPCTHKTYYKDALLQQFKEDFVTDLRRQQPTTAMLAGTHDTSFLEKVLIEPENEEQEIDRKQIGAQQIATVLNAVLAKHKENDPLFERLPTGVYIAGSELQQLLQDAASGGVVSDGNADDHITVTDTYKTGKREHGITQARLYVEAVTDDVAAYAYELFAPYFNDDYQKTAWITVPQEKQNAPTVK